MLVAAATTVAGLLAALHYHAVGLALAHYDARAHLVVARRILDSLMPGWQQIGAVWLPLPHLLNMIPVQVDAWYRSGASAIAISVLSMATAAGALAWFVLARGGSAAAALSGAALLLANPNLLYLQSTPMTEPLLFAAMLVTIALTADWLDDGAVRPPRGAGLALMTACMTRYEAWPFAAVLVALSAAVMRRRGAGPVAVLRACARLALPSAIAAGLFVLNSRWTVGAWFVSSGFFVAENEALGQVPVAWRQIREGLYRLSGSAVVWPAYVSAAALTIVFVRWRARSSVVLALAPAAAALLPLYAYVQGHPFRIRYSLPLVVACATLTATGIALLPRRVAAAAAAAVVAATLWQSHPLDRSAPLVAEAQRDAANQQARAAVTDYLREHHDGTPVMMSMGSLAHYMHDLSAIGLGVAAFLHEGNGEVWKAAMRYGPRGYVGWIGVEQQAEGGDAVFHEAARRPRWLDGFEEVARGGGVVLYRAVRAEDASR